MNKNKQKINIKEKFRNKKLKAIYTDCKSLGKCLKNYRNGKEYMGY